MPRISRPPAAGGKSTHEQLMAACDHRALVAEKVGGLLVFYRCHNCAARFDTQLTPRTVKPVAPAMEAV